MELRTLEGKTSIVVLNQNMRVAQYIFHDTPHYLLTPPFALYFLD